MRVFSRDREAARLGLVALVFSVSLLALPSTPAGAAGELVFRARVGDLGIRTRHQQAGTPDDEVIEAVLPGRLYAPPRELGAIDRAQAGMTTPETAVQADFSAWKADDAEWILGNFAAGDQAALTAFLDDSEMRAASKKGFARDAAVFLWGVVEHGDYALVLVTYGQGEDRARGLVATFVREGGAWRRTNALSADETMDVVWTAFRMGEMAAR